MLAGNVKAEQAQLNIEATDITINGNVESRSGEGAGHLPYVGIKASGDAVINGSMVAHWAEGNSEHAYGLEIEGKNVAVNAGENNVLYNGAGKANIAADEKLTLNGKNGLINEGGDINVSAKNVNITAEKYAVLSYVGNTNITGSGSSNITGDILLSGLYTNAAPVVNIELGNGSSITGAIVNEREQAAYALA